MANASAVALVAMLMLSLWAAWTSDDGAAHVVSGWAMPNEAGTAISLHDSPEAPGEGYIIAGARWRGVDELWHDGADIPTCVGTDTRSSTRVTLAVVPAETPDGGTWQQVVWLECLEQPRR